jgi:GTPase SAR1 family protein
MYSVTDRNSFSCIDEWYDRILRRKNARECPMVLVGTKCDLEDERQVSMEEGQKKAEGTVECACIDINR